MTLLSSLRRKIDNVVEDPILRRWMVTRLLHGESPIGRAPAMTRPPYLDGCVLSDGIIGDGLSTYLVTGAPQAAADLDLAGRSIRLEPGSEDELVASVYDDREVELAMHRFAWMPVLGAKCDPAWVDAIWRAWIRRFGDTRSGWAWHPYTAAERLINISTFASSHGLPGPRELTGPVLSAHGAAIHDHLEYYGPSATGNHLANNGRGLFLGGLSLRRPDWVDIGERILLEQASRLFTPSGMLREGSSHYHLLVTRWYIEAWLAADLHGRPTCSQFKTIAGRALAAAHGLILPGGFPLVGDVSPDCPPGYLVSLGDNTASGWLATLSDANRNKLSELSASIPSAAALAEDGWIRIDMKSWSMLAYAAPTGWHPMPGHAHRDFGGFELHYNASNIVCDLGRRSYEPTGLIDIDATRHSTLTIDGHSAYPINRPYYSDAFRAAVCPKPTLTWSLMEASIETNAFARLANVGNWTRRWHAGDGKFFISDHVLGRGRHKIVRHLHTTLPVSRDGEKIQIGPHLIEVHGTIDIYPSIRWFAYGRGELATSISIETESELPWQSTIIIHPRPSAS